MNTLIKENSIDLKFTDSDYDKFNPTDDVDKIRRALRGITTNQKAIIEIITNRKNHERQKLKIVYKKLFNRSLVQDLHDSLSENLKQTIYALLLTPAELNAFIFKKALDSNELNNLVECFITQSSFEIIQAKIAYQNVFSTSLEDDINQQTQSNLILQKFLKYLVIGITPLHDLVDLKLAHKDLRDIFGNNELWFDETRFVLVLCSRSHAQLKAMFDEYKKISGHMFEEKLKNELSRNKLFLECVISFTECIRDKKAYFARVLHNSSHVDIMKVIVCRSEKDLDEIKQKFKNMYNQSLHDHLKKTTSGNYQMALLNLAGNDDE